MSDVTQLLCAVDRGDSDASERLLATLYDELRRLAAHLLSKERSGQTLQPTALVHEAYLRLVKPDAQPEWNSRRHFFAAAAEAMRRILVENARRKLRIKHGGRHQRVPFHEDELAIDAGNDDVLALDEALSAFAAEDPVKAELVELRAFGGLSEEEAAETLQISRATASRYWAYARAWLYERIAEADADSP